MWAATCARSRSGSLEPIHYCVESRQNIALARNRALSEASGEWILFIDDDEAADENWIAEYLKLVEREPCDGAFGPVLPRLEEVVAPWIDVQTFYAGRRHPTGEPLGAGDLYTNNALVRRRPVPSTRGGRGAGHTLEKQSEPTSGGVYKDMRERIREIQQYQLTAADITPEVVTTMLFKEANTAKSDSARVTAQTRLGQVHAMFVEKRIEERREYDVVAMMRLIAGENPELLARMAEMLPLMPDERALISGDSE